METMLYNIRSCKSGTGVTENLEKSRYLILLIKNNLIMKRNFKFSMFFLVLIMTITSAFVVSPIKSGKNDSLSSSVRVNELYWYASDNTTYTNRFENVSDEISFLATAQPLYNFYSTPVSGSVAYEYGYDVEDPSGSPAGIVYRKAK